MKIARYLNSRPLRCYAFALLTPFVALIVINYLPWTFGEGPFLLPLMVPIVGAAVYGGLLPGLLATLVSVIGAIWIMPPTGSFTINSDLNVFRCALFTIASLLLTFLIDKLRRAKHARDIAFAEVQESRMRFESTFQQAAVGMAVVAPDGRWLRVNQKLCDILGYSEPELLARTFQDLTYPDDLNADLDHLNRMLARESVSYAMEKRYIRQDGSVVWANLTVALTWQSDGTPDYFISVVEDISERKRVENALQHALEEARDANSANRAKSAFLANMSHEIRTPMNAILGATQLLKSNIAEPVQIDLLDIQEKAGKHLLALVSDILDLSRIEAGKFELAETEVDLARLVDHALTMVRGDAAAKGLALSVNLQPPSGKIAGDPTCLLQALLNYLSNAVKFTERGSIAVKIYPVAEDADSVLIRFEVQDTGIGIAPESLPILFKPFEQADSGITRRYGGSGLGLVITRRLATLMGGTADAKSTPGCGSTFWFTARLRTRAEGASNCQQNFDTASAPVSASFKGFAVLVVDDDPVNLQLLGMMAENYGLTAATAGSGQQAIAMVQAKRFDLILMDINMPQQSGLDTIAQIRRLPGYRHVPAIAVSAGVFDDDRAQALAAGFTDFLPKPVGLNELAAKIQQCLPGSQQRYVGRERFPSSA